MKLGWLGTGVAVGNVHRRTAGIYTNEQFPWACKENSSPLAEEPLKTAYNTLNSGKFDAGWELYARLNVPSAEEGTGCSWSNPRPIRTLHGPIASFPTSKWNVLRTRSV